MFDGIKEDIQSVFHRDPAARSAFEVLTNYPGLQCSYYEGEWRRLPEFDSLTSIKDFIADTVVIPESARAEDYGLVFRGFIEVPTDGMYEFDISSATVIHNFIDNNVGSRPY